MNMMWRASLAYPWRQSADGAFFDKVPSTSKSIAPSDIGPRILRHGLSHGPQAAASPNQRPGEERIDATYPPRAQLGSAVREQQEPGPRPNVLVSGAERSQRRWVHRGGNSRGRRRPFWGVECPANGGVPGQTEGRLVALRRPAAHRGVTGSRDTTSRTAH